MWRLVLEDVVSYSEAKKMTMPEIFEANAALDIHIANINQARQKGANQ